MEMTVRETEQGVILDADGLPSVDDFMASPACSSSSPVLRDNHHHHHPYVDLGSSDTSCIERHDVSFHMSPNSGTPDRCPQRAQNSPVLDSSGSPAMMPSPSKRSMDASPRCDTQRSVASLVARVASPVRRRGQVVQVNGGEMNAPPEGLRDLSSQPPPFNATMDEVETVPSALMAAATQEVPPTVLDPQSSSPKLEADGFPCVKEFLASPISSNEENDSLLLECLRMEDEVESPNGERYLARRPENVPQLDLRCVRPVVSDDGSVGRYLMSSEQINTAEMTEASEESPRTSQQLMLQDGHWELPMDVEAEVSPLHEKKPLSPFTADRRQLWNRYVPAGRPKILGESCAEVHRLPPPDAASCIIPHGSPQHEGGGHQSPIHQAEDSSEGRINGLTEGSMPAGPTDAIPAAHQQMLNNVQSEGTTVGLGVSTQASPVGAATPSCQQACSDGDAQGSRQLDSNPAIQVGRPEHAPDQCQASLPPVTSTSHSTTGIMPPAALPPPIMRLPAPASWGAFQETVLPDAALQGSQANSGSSAQQILSTEGRMQQIPEAVVAIETNIGLTGAISQGAPVVASDGGAVANLSSGVCMNQSEPHTGLQSEGRMELPPTFLDSQTQRSMGPSNTGSAPVTTEMAATGIDSGAQAAIHVATSAPPATEGRMLLPNAHTSIDSCGRVASSTSIGAQGFVPPLSMAGAVMAGMGTGQQALMTEGRMECRNAGSIGDFQRTGYMASAAMGFDGGNIGMNTYMAGVSGPMHVPLRSQHQDYYAGQIRSEGPMMPPAHATMPPVAHTGSIHPNGSHIPALSSSGPLPAATSATLDTEHHSTSVMEVATCRQPELASVSSNGVLPKADAASSDKPPPDNNGIALNTGVQNLVAGDSCGVPPSGLGNNPLNGNIAVDEGGADAPAASREIMSAPVSDSRDTVHSENIGMAHDDKTASCGPSPVAPEVGDGEPQRLTAGGSLPATPVPYLSETCVDTGELPMGNGDVLPNFDEGLSSSQAALQCSSPPPVDAIVASPGGPPTFDQGQQTTPDKTMLVPRHPRKRAAGEPLPRPRKEGRFSLVEIGVDQFSRSAASMSRPVRHLIRPLDHWRNEALVYERKPGSALPTVTAVVVAKPKLPADTELPPQQGLVEESVSFAVVTPPSQRYKRKRSEGTDGGLTSKTTGDKACVLAPRTRLRRAMDSKPAVPVSTLQPTSGHSRSPRITLGARKKKLIGNEATTASSSEAIATSMPIQDEGGTLHSRSAESTSHAAGSVVQKKMHQGRQRAAGPAVQEKMRQVRKRSIGVKVPPATMQLEPLEEGFCRVPPAEGSDAACELRVGLDNGRWMCCDIRIPPRSFNTPETLGIGKALVICILSAERGTLVAELSNVRMDLMSGDHILVREGCEYCLRNNSVTEYAHMKMILMMQPGQPEGGGDGNRVEGGKVC